MEKRANPLSLDALLQADNILNQSKSSGTKPVADQTTKRSDIAKTAPINDMAPSKNANPFNYSAPSFRPLQNPVNQLKPTPEPNIRQLASKSPPPNHPMYAYPVSQPMYQMQQPYYYPQPQMYAQHLVHPVPSMANAPYSQLMSRQQMPFTASQNRPLVRQDTSDSILALEDIIDMHLNKHQTPPPPKPHIIRQATTSSSTGAIADPNSDFAAASALFHASYATENANAPRKRAKKLTKKQVKDLTPEQILELKKRYKCSYCTKSFVRPSSLAQHVRSHTGEHPFQCSFCSKSFSVKSNWRRHERLHGTHGNVLPESVQQQELEHINSEDVAGHASESEFEYDTLTTSFTQ